MNSPIHPTARQLAGLSAEQLVQHVRSRVDVTSESSYARDERVPAARIHPYPKRRRASSEPTIAHVAAPVAVAEPTYADFLRLETSRQLATA
jgi:hypothetical protein